MPEGFRGRRKAGGQGAGHRQDGNGPADGAARAGDVRQAEPGNAGIAVVIASARRARRRVRTPLDHPERHGSSGKGVTAAFRLAAPAGADERGDQSGRVLDDSDQRPRLPGGPVHGRAVPHHYQAHEQGRGSGYYLFYVCTISHACTTSSPIRRGQATANLTFSDIGEATRHNSNKAPLTWDYRPGKVLTQNISLNNSARFHRAPMVLVGELPRGHRRDIML